jgi:hypothetical protein
MGEAEVTLVPIDRGDVRRRCGVAAKPDRAAIPLECKALVTPYALTNVIRVAERAGRGRITTLSCASKEANRIG